jgi:hypothetical protein
MKYVKQDYLIYGEAYKDVINEYEILLEKIIDENDKESVINININKCILCKK